jgi:hypothetical protein
MAACPSEDVDTFGSTDCGSTLRDNVELFSTGGVDDRPDNELTVRVRTADGLGLR